MQVAAILGILYSDSLVFGLAPKYNLPLWFLVVWCVVTAALLFLPWFRKIDNEQESRKWKKPTKNTAQRSRAATRRK